MNNNKNSSSCESKLINNKTSNNMDNTSKTKIRKNINVSIQKRNFDKLNCILNNWDDEELNLSNEVCKSILFKNELENNPLTQTLLSTLNLIKTNLKNKNLFDYPSDEALFIALKNIISIKINATELSSFLEDDFYFATSTNSPNTNSLDNIQDTIINNKNTSTDVENNNINSEFAIDITQEDNINSTNSNSKNLSHKNDTTTNNDILEWRIPDAPNFTKNKGSSSNNSTNETNNIDKEELLNQRFNAFSYPIG